MSLRNDRAKHFDPEDGGMILRTVDIHVQDYTLSQCRRPQPEQSQSSNPQNTNMLTAA
jgi:hypothetical protein